MAEDDQIEYMYKFNNIIKPKRRQSKVAMLHVDLNVASTFLITLNLDLNSRRSKCFNNNVVINTDHQKSSY